MRSSSRRAPTSNFTLQATWLMPRLLEDPETTWFSKRFGADSAYKEVVSLPLALRALPSFKEIPACVSIGGNQVFTQPGPICRKRLPEPERVPRLNV